MLVNLKNNMKILRSMMAIRISMIMAELKAMELESTIPMSVTRKLFSDYRKIVLTRDSKKCLLLFNIFFNCLLSRGVDQWLDPGHLHLDKTLHYW